MGYRKGSVVSVVEADFVRMESRRHFASHVVGAQFVHMESRRIFVKNVMVRHCARLHCVRHTQTAGTKDTVYIALSICSHMGLHLENYKTKEIAVATYLTEMFRDITWAQEKKIEGGCSRRRPDLFLDMGRHVVIVEVDENKHDEYDCTCENRRWMEISQDLNHRHIVMIRFNPDGYVCTEKGKIPTPWTYTKQGMSTIKKNDTLSGMLDWHPWQKQ